MLLEVGGRELVMLAWDDGVSCLYMSAQNGHLDVVKTLLEAGGRELLILTKKDRDSCLSISAREGIWRWWKRCWRAGDASCCC